MKIGIGLEIDAEVRHLSAVVNRIEQKLVECAAGKEYGSGIDNLYIGLVIVRPEAIKFHPTRRLSYKKRSKHRDLASGVVTELSNLVEYDVSPDFLALHSLAENEAQTYIVDEILKSLDIIGEHRGKFRGFDLERFRSDLAMCLTGIKEGGN